MDRNTTIGFLLITAVLMIWIFFVTPRPEEPLKQQMDTTKTVTQTKNETIKDTKPSETLKLDSLAINKAKIDSFGVFSGKTSGSNDVITIETDKVIAKIEKKGGNILEWTLKEFKTWYDSPVQLIKNEHGGDFNILLTTLDGKLVNTKNFYFESNFKNGDYIKVAEGQKYILELRIALSPKEGIRVSSRITPIAI